MFVTPSRMPLRRAAAAPSPAMQAIATTAATDRCAISRAVQLRRGVCASGCGRQLSPARRRGQKSARPKIASAAGTRVIGDGDRHRDGDREPRPELLERAHPRHLERHQAGGQDRPAGDHDRRRLGGGPRRRAQPRLAPQRLRARVGEIEDDVVGDDPEHERHEQGAQERRLLEARPPGHAGDQLLGQGVRRADRGEREERARRGRGTARPRAGRPGRPWRSRSAAARGRPGRPRAAPPGRCRSRRPGRRRGGRCLRGSDRRRRSAPTRGPPRDSRYVIAVVPVSLEPGTTPAAFTTGSAIRPLRGSAPKRRPVGARGPRIHARRDGRGEAVRVALDDLGLGGERHAEEAQGERVRLQRRRVGRDERDERVGRLRGHRAAPRRRTRPRATQPSRIGQRSLTTVHA